MLSQVLPPFSRVAHTEDCNIMLHFGGTQLSQPTATVSWPKGFQPLSPKQLLSRMKASTFSPNQLGSSDLSTLIMQKKLYSYTRKGGWGVEKKRKEPVFISCCLWEHMHSFLHTHQAPAFIPSQWLFLNLQHNSLRCTF